MVTYEFKLILAESEADEDIANRLYDAGCDDGTLASRDGVAFISFDREAPSIEAAIRGAVAQVTAAGCTVLKVEIPAAAFA